MLNNYSRFEDGTGQEFNVSEGQVLCFHAPDGRLNPPVIFYLLRVSSIEQDSITVSFGKEGDNANLKLHGIIEPDVDKNGKADIFIDLIELASDKKAKIKIGLTNVKGTSIEGKTQQPDGSWIINILPIVLTLGACLTLSFVLC